MQRAEVYELVGRRLGARAREVVDAAFSSARKEIAELRDALVELRRDFTDRDAHHARMVESLEIATGTRDTLALLERRVSELPSPRDGEPGRDGKDGAPGAPGEPGRDGADGKEGAPGRDALELEILDNVDPQKSYPRGTVAAYRGGLIKADRRTGPITGALGDAGWRVILRGVADTEVVPSDDLRTLKIRITHTDGEAVEQSIRSPAVIYREIYREGQDYEPGDAVTFGGSLWIALRATQSKPGDGSPDWRLAVKKGRDAK